MAALMTRTMPSRFEEMRTRRASRVVTLAESIYGLAIDVDDFPDPSRGHQAMDRYHRQLEYAAKYINMQAKRMEHILVVNLGHSDPADSLLQTLFNNHVVDLPQHYHDQPPGTSVLPLDVLFSICSCIKSWLDLSKNNVVLLHIRSSSGIGMDTLKFVQHCFMAFNGEHEELDDYISLISGGSIPGTIGNQGGLARIGGPSQQRYSKYFLHILLSPSPPERRDTALSIKSIKFEGVNYLRRAKNLKASEHSMFHTPLLMVYQKGTEVWRGHCAGGGSAFDFALDICVTGDIVLGLWLIKDIKMPGESPIVSFAFHTSFMSPGEFDFAAKRLDLNKAAVAGDLSMNIVFEESTIPVKSMKDSCTVGTDILEMRQMWQEQRALTRKLLQTDCLTPTSSLSNDVEDNNCIHAAAGSLAPSPWSTNDAFPNNESAKPEVAICGRCERWINGNGSDVSSPPEDAQDGFVSDVHNQKGGPEVVSPVVEDDAPSTPSTTESSLIRVGLIDDDSEAVPSSSDANDASSGAGSIPSKGACDMPKTPPPPPPPPGRPRNPRVPPAPSLQKAAQNRPLTRTRSFYWTKTPKQSGTVWCELTNNERLPESMSKMLVNMFGVEHNKEKAPAVVSAGAKIPGKSKHRDLKIVSSGRATNVSIMMSRFKSFEGGVEGLCKAVLSGKGLLVEDLKLLSQMAPREDEVKAFKDFEGMKDDLFGAEHILVQMCEVPRLKEKANCWVIMDNWHTNYQKASQIMQVTKMACQQIKESNRLRTVLEAVLTVGNSMNMGTHRGNAGGCRVESLLKLADTKVTNGLKSVPDEEGSAPSSSAPKSSPIGSLLDFVAMVVANQEGGVVDDSRFLSEELTVLAEADAYMDGTVVELLDEVREGFEAVELEVASAMGCKWPIIDTKNRAQIEEMELKGGGRYVEEEKKFIIGLYDFLKESVEGRGILRREYSVSIQFLRSAATWLGEPDNANPMRVIRDLFEFVKLFDEAYSRLGTGTCRQL